MKDRLHILSCLCLIVLAVLCVGGTAAAAPGEYDIALLTLINEARQAPLRTAEALGLDPQETLASLPELRDVLLNGLPPLAHSDNLYTAAAAHAADMLEKDYFDRQSPDGRTPADRIRDAGYVPANSGESLGMLGFQNFIAASQAVVDIFNTLFLEELNPQTTQERNILNPLMEDLGVSLAAGQFSSGGWSWNAYMAVCDFAATGLDLAGMETELYARINTARAAPQDIAEMLAVPPEVIEQVFAARARALQDGLRPLARSAVLQDTARAHGQDMAARVYFSPISPEGALPVDRMAAAGYEADEAGEALAVVALTGYANEETITERLFADLFQNALQDEQAGGGSPLLVSSMLETGVAVVPTVFPSGDGLPVRVYLLVADVARPLEPSFYVLGTVYYDADGNGLLDPGEGLPGLTVALEPGLGMPGATIAAVTSDAQGHYQLELEPFSFVDLTVRDEQGDLLAQRLLVGELGNLGRNVDVDLP